MQTVYSHALAVKALATGTATITTGTTVGAVIDTNLYNNNFRDVLFAIQAGVLTDGSYQWSVTECATSGGSYTAVPADRLQGSLASLASTDDQVLLQVGVRPTMRYVQLSVVATSATSGGVFSALAVLSNGGLGPVARA